MGEDIALAGTLIRDGDHWIVRLEDGQSLRVEASHTLTSPTQVMIVVTTKGKYEQEKHELARHLLAEILNGTKV